jgi:hypothetical protein
MSLFSLLKSTSTSTSASALVHPTCIFLDWIEGAPAKWLTVGEMEGIKPNIKWQTIVKWKELNSDIIIATNYQSTVNPVDSSSSTGSVPYLKSHLQKSIRRSNSFKAVKTASLLFRIDALELLRRLAIIAVEDAMPVSGYSTLVWLIAACSGGYTLSEEHHCWILGYVHNLCCCSHYEQVPKPTTPPDQAVKSLRLRSLTGEGRDLCYSLLFRQAYGGMGGDKELLRSATELWAARYRVNSEFIKLLSVPTYLITPPQDPLTPNEWIAAAVDYHCYPGIILNLSEKHDEFTPEDIKEAIWHCSSSLTNKANIAENLKQRDNTSARHQAVWRVIKRDFLSLARFMISRTQN